MHRIVVQATDPLKASPFSMTKKEQDMLDPNYKKPKRKGADELGVDESVMGGGEAMFELAALKRASQKMKTVTHFVHNSKRMFQRQYSLDIKHTEKVRLERVLTQEESALHLAETELKLAQQAFDQFLQDKDRKAIEAQRRADQETQNRLEKATDIQEVDERILGLERDLSNMRDTLGEYNVFERFLFSLSPEAWRLAQEGTDEEEQHEPEPAVVETQESAVVADEEEDEKEEAAEAQPIDKTQDEPKVEEKKAVKKRKKSASKKEEKESSDSSDEDDSSDSSSSSSSSEDEERKEHPESEQEDAEENEALSEPEKEPEEESEPEPDPVVPKTEEELVVELTAENLGVTLKDLGKICGSPMLYFQQPNQLLSILTDLEDENLTLIQKCQELEDKLEETKINTRQTVARLNEQAGNFEADIGQLERQIQGENHEMDRLAQAVTVTEGQQDEMNRDEASVKSVENEEPTLSTADKTLLDLDALVSKIHLECVGESRAILETLDKLKRIELRMEDLTQTLESLPDEKVKIARKTCERERRQREQEARQEHHRQLMAERNQRALDRALKPVYVKPEMRKFQQGVDWLKRRQRALRIRQRERRESSSSDSSNMTAEDDFKEDREEINFMMP